MSKPLPKARAARMPALFLTMPAEPPVRTPAGARGVPACAEEELAPFLLATG